MSIPDKKLEYLTSVSVTMLPCSVHMYVWFLLTNPGLGWYVYSLYVQLFLHNLIDSFLEAISSCFNPILIIISVIFVLRHTNRGEAFAFFNQIYSIYPTLDKYQKLEWHKRKRRDKMKANKVLIDKTIYDRYITFSCC